MKRLIALILCFALLLSVAPVALAAEEATEVYADCTFDTYIENNQGKIKTYDDEATLFVGSVYKRYAQLKFDISGFAGKEFSGKPFGGSVLSITVRNAFENTSLTFLGTPDGTRESAYMLTAFQPKATGKTRIEVAITDYVKEALEKGQTELVFFVEYSGSVITLFADESSNQADRPALRITEEEPYIKGQIGFKYPVVTAAQFKADLAPTVAKGHPWMFASQADFDRVRDNLDKDPYLKKWFASITERCENYITNGVSNTDTILEGAYNSRGDEAKNAIIYNAFAYQMTGDERYADRAWAEMDALLTLPTWGTSQYIDNNQLVFGCAIGYDWLYNWMEQDKRDKTIEGLKKLHYDTMYDMMTNKGSSKYTEGFYAFYWNSNNHALLDNTYTFLGAMAIADVDIDYSTKIMQGDFEYMKPVVERWYPDGAWYESLGYWGYTGPYMAKWLMGMEKALGTSYGLSDLQCMKNIVNYPIYGSSSTYMFTINDGTYEGPRPTIALYELALINGNRELQKYCLDNTSDYVWTCLAYDLDFDYSTVEASSFALDNFFRNNDQVTFRNTWEGNQETYCGMFVQDAGETHGVMNSGTLGLEAFGHQWITNMGRDNYSLDGYWGSAQDGKRWRYYFSRAEANSCLVIDPGLEGGHRVRPGDVINTYKSMPRGAYAITDLTNTYVTTASSYKRGIMFGNDRTQMVVQDEVHLNQEEEVYAFYNLNKCDIKLSEDGKTVYCNAGGKKLRINILCDVPYKASIMSATPLPTSPQMEGNRIVKDIRRLALHFDSVKDFNLRLEFTPYLTEDELPEPATEITPLEQWTIPEGEFAPLDRAEKIYLDGVEFAEFNPANRCYKVDVMPSEIKAVADSRYEISYRENDAKTEKYVVLRNKETGKVTSYLFELPEIIEAIFEIDGGNKEVGVVGVTASSHDGNVPDNTIDKNMQTRWSAKARQNITFQLEDKVKLSYIALAMYGGDARSTYMDIQVSNDKKTWETVKVLETCGISTDFEYFELKDVEARYIRLNCYGTSKDQWNSITEFKAFKKN